jgi:hypothetical protein
MLDFAYVLDKNFVHAAVIFTGIAVLSKLGSGTQSCGSECDEYPALLLFIFDDDNACS